jgi:hypothetical protein
MGSVAVATKGKGALALPRRVRVIGARYGHSPRRMERRLQTLLDLAERSGFRPTLPITAAAAMRNRDVVARYVAVGVEFAVHGYRHVDHRSLGAVDQLEELGRAKLALEATGARVSGFRAPYLRWNEDTMAAVRENRFAYDSSEAMHWPVNQALETDAYRRVIEFCGAVPADRYPVLPRTDDGLLRIPYCIPDDEAVIDRLRLRSAREIADIWLGILRATVERGELFSLGVHPERIDPCAVGIAAVLDEAKEAGPRVWVARLEEIAAWWRVRSAATMHLEEREPNVYEVRVDGPQGVTILAHGLDVAGAEPWDDRYTRVRTTRFMVRTDRRPVIGISVSSPPSLSTFLGEQGYVIEQTDTGAGYHSFLNPRAFSRADERPLLQSLESSGNPLLRLGRWPDGARCALSVTGDVDALTIWDYAFRFLGR